MNRIHDHGSAPFSSCSRSSATADTAMTGSQIDPNIVSQDVTAFIATGVIAYPQQDPAYEGKYRGALRDIRSQDLSRPDPRSEYPDGTPALFKGAQGYRIPAQLVRAGSVGAEPEGGVEPPSKEERRW
jgi:hypothetical protein